MNSISFKNDGNIGIAESYYAAMLRKDFDQMGSYLHPDVVFIGPLADMSGKDSVIVAARYFSQILISITIRSKFESGNQIMFAYDLMFHEPINTLRAAVLMEFTHNLISKIELFYDAKAFETEKTKIFKNE